METTVERCTVLHFEWKLNQSEHSITMSPMFEYQSEKVFRVGLKRDEANKSCVIFFVSVNHFRCGFKIRSVLCSQSNDSKTYYLMIPRSEPENIYIQLFHKPFSGFFRGTPTFTFRVSLTAITDDYSYQIVDSLMGDQLWMAAKSSQGTDFEFVVQERVFPAHRVILAARSPVFATIMDTAPNVSKLVITDIKPDLFQHFLCFIYTGRLSTTANNQQLLFAADKYQVETLKNLCQTATRDISSEDLTAILMNLTDLID